MILDRQGRLFGRVNLLDLLALFFLLALGGTLWYATRVSEYKALKILSSEPKRVVAGSGTRVGVKGTGFDPETTIRLGDYNDERPDYLDESTAVIEIRDQFEPGVYRIIVRDGRGRYAALADAVEIVWIPHISEVKPKIIYSEGEGSRFEVTGKFFTRPSAVRVGGRPLELLGVTGHTRIEAQLRKGDPPLPLGEQPVTVINTGGQSVTLEQGVTVAPPPEVLHIEPSNLLLGQSVELDISGKNFREGTRVWFSNELIGEATVVSPERMRISVTGSPEVTRQGLLLEPPNGPKVLALENALTLRDAVTVPVVVALTIDQKGLRMLEFLKQLPEWKLKRPLEGRKLRRSVRATRRNFSINAVEILDLPTLEVVLAARVEPVGRGYRILYGDLPLRVGETIIVLVNGKRISGTVATEPIAIFGDDLLKTGGGY